MMRRVALTIAIAVAIVTLLAGAAPAMATEHEVECFSCHTDGSQGAAGELKALPAGHPSTGADTSMPSTGLMAIIPAIGLLAVGAGMTIYLKK